MGRPRKYVGEILDDLLNMELNEFCNKYPNEDRNKARALRSYHQRRKDKMESEGRLYKTWETSAYDHQAGEWVTTTNHGYEYAQDPELPEDAFISQAPPIKLSTPKRKPVNRDYELLAFLPDEQIGFREIDGELVPIHDEAAMSAARLMLRDLQPDFVYANGDSIDFPTMSKYAKDSLHFTPRTIQESINRAAQWNAEITEATPNAKRRVRMAGNHDRLSKYILANAEQLYGLRRGSLTKEPPTEPILSTAYLTRAEELGWTYVSSYPGEFRHDNDFVVVHGDRVRSNGSTAELMSKTYPDRNVVFGHVHRRELHTRQNWDGREFTAASFGTLARTDGYVPSYGSSVNEVTNQPTERMENWVQGIGLVESYGNGEYNFIFVTIRNGIARFRGKEYDGNES